jgi:hypothetical protein
MKKDKNDQQAIRYVDRLVRETCKRVERLNRIARSAPELVIPIARQQIRWPGFISRKRAFQKENSELMDAIHLGENFKLTGEWHPRSASTRGALSVHWWGSVLQKTWGLPQLTKKNKKRWFNRTWSCMVRYTQFTPESDPLYRSLAGTPAAKRAEIKRKIYRSFAKNIRPK